MHAPCSGSTRDTFMKFKPQNANLVLSTPAFISCKNLNK